MTYDDLTVMDVLFEPAAEPPLSAVLHHPSCPECGSVAASMLRAGDPRALCARCAPEPQIRRRGNPEAVAS